MAETRHVHLHRDNDATEQREDGIAVRCLMYHTRIVKSVLDRPEDYEDGISGVVLDDSHTLVLASDHDDANPSVTKDDIDAFVEDYETASSHPDSGIVQAEIRPPDGMV